MKLPSWKEWLFIAVLVTTYGLITSCNVNLPVIKVGDKVVYQGESVEVTGVSYINTFPAFFWQDKWKTVYHIETGDGIRIRDVEYGRLDLPQPAL
jgi:hypothetical protein